jgi:tetratricopeptide (TPR) repeat protein
MQATYNKAIGIFLVVGLILTISSLVFAAEAKIQGKIIDKDGNPIAGAKIILRDNSGRTFVTKSKKDGSYYKRGIPPATYDFSVEKEGYKTKTFTLTLRAGAVERNDIPLVPASPEEIGGEDYIKALELYKNKEYDKAVALFEKVIEKEPDMGLAYYNLGITYIALEQYEKALAAVQRSIELLPENSALYTTLGKIYMAQAETDKALEWFNKAIELKPEAQTYFDIGAAFYNSNQKQEAIANFEKAVEIDPKFSPAYYFLGILHFGLEEFDKAVEALNKYIELEPNAPNINEVRDIIKQIESIKNQPKEKPE